MAAVERQGQGCPNQHRPYPPGHARLSRRAEPPKIRSSIEEALDGLGEAEWLSLRSKQLVGQLRRTSPRWVARGDSAHRGDGEFPRQSPDEQIAANAMDTTRRGPSAAGPQRRLQWNSRHCLWPTVCAGPWSTPTNHNGRLTPRF